MKRVARVVVVLLVIAGVTVHLGLWAGAGLVVLAAGIAVHVGGGVAAHRWWRRSVRSGQG